MAKSLPAPAGTESPDSCLTTLPNPPDIPELPSTSAICLLNCQGISPRATSHSKWKIPYISETILGPDKSSSIPILAITETWLKDYISDAQISIKDYSVIRADREKRKGGGTLLYIHSSLPYSDVEKYSDSTCEAVICTIEGMKAIVACVYRPPNCSKQQTKQLLSFLSQYLNKFSQSPHMDIHILGDLNMPNIDWSSLTISPKLGRNQTENLLNTYSRKKKFQERRNFYYAHTWQYKII